MIFNRDALKIAMAKNCVSIAELAKKSKVGSDTIAKILNTNRIPNIATIGRLATALNVSPEVLMKED